jgi:hypothetical protein
LPRDVPPRLLEAAGLAGRTLVADVISFAADVKGSLARSDYTWNRNTAGDGSFITGRDGGIFQSHQPGLPLVLLPGYAIDRYWFSTGTVYGGQFPDRLPLLHATLLLIAALGAAAVALLCLHAGLDRAWAIGFGFLSWASFPASAMALQIYPETCAALAIAGALALLAGPQKFAAGGAAAIGFAAGFPGCCTSASCWVRRRCWFTGSGLCATRGDAPSPSRSAGRYPWRPSCGTSTTPQACPGPARST